MKLINRNHWIGLSAIVISTACATTPSSTNYPGDISSENRPENTVEKETDPSGKLNPSGKSPVWSLVMPSGEFVYRVQTDAQVAVADSNTTIESASKGTYDFRSIPTNREEVRLSVTDTTISVLQPSEAELRGCSDTKSMMIKAKNIIPIIPQSVINSITVGTTWSEFVKAEYCRGTIPLQTEINRKYVVLGDTTDGQGGKLIRLAKTESIVSSGQGNEGQHKVLVSIDGKSDAVVYVNPTSGAIEKINGEQVSLVSIFSSGRKSTFIQKVSEQIKLVH